VHRNWRTKRVASLPRSRQVTSLVTADGDKTRPDVKKTPFLWRARRQLLAVDCQNGTCCLPRNRAGCCPLKTHPGVSADVLSGLANQLVRLCERSTEAFTGPCGFAAEARDSRGRQCVSGETFPQRCCERRAKIGVFPMFADVITRIRNSEDNGVANAFTQPVEKVHPVASCSPLAVKWTRGRTFGLNLYRPIQASGCNGCPARSGLRTWAEIAECS